MYRKFKSASCRAPRTSLLLYRCAGPEWAVSGLDRGLARAPVELSDELDQRIRRDKDPEDPCAGRIGLASRIASFFGLQLTLTEPVEPSGYRIPDICQGSHHLVALTFFSNQRHSHLAYRISTPQAALSDRVFSKQLF